MRLTDFDVLTFDMIGTLIDFERGQPLELQSLFLEPLRQAIRAGVAMPRLSALCAVLKDLDRTAHPAR